AIDLVLLQRKRDVAFPRNIESVEAEMTLEIKPGIDLEQHAREIVHHVFDRQMRVAGLEMIGQAVVRAAKIVPFVFDPGPEIPKIIDMEAMIETEVGVDRVAVSEPAVVK